MPKKKLPKPSQWVRVRFDDVGVRDALCVEVGNRWITVLEVGCSTNAVQNVDHSQIVALGPFVTVPRF